MVELVERTIKPTVVEVVEELVVILEKVEKVVIITMVLMERELLEAMEHQELTQEA
jgi:hypothetical protein